MIAATALGNGARRILDTLGVWHADRRRMRPRSARSISRTPAASASPGSTPPSIELAAFGYTVSNRHLGAALWRSLRAQRPPRAAQSGARDGRSRRGAGWAELCGTRAARGRGRAGRDSVVHARLVVAADGAHSLVKQAAGIDSSERRLPAGGGGGQRQDRPPARGIAYERFTAAGPLALLPLADGAYTVVWTLAPERAPALREACERRSSAEQLQRAFGWRAGQILAGRQARQLPAGAGARARGQPRQRVALIGNACAGAASGCRAGLQPGAARCGGAGRTDRRGGGSRARQPCWREFAGAPCGRPRAA